MFQRVIVSLKEKRLLTPTVFVLALLIVLSFIILLGQFFHQSLQEEMAVQFNMQQLLLAREVAINVEGFIDRVYKDLHIISQLPNIHNIQESPRCHTIVDAINLNIQNEMLITMRILDRNGAVLYDSAYPGREGTDLSRTEYFKKARLLGKNEKLVTDLLPSPDQHPDSKQFIVATPVYQKRGTSPAPEFNGVVMAVLSMNGITQKYLSQIKSGTRGYAWMMDSTGTLLYHPTQPQMVGKNLYQADQSCYRCHKSFDTEKKMIEGTTKTYGYYEAPGGENKVMAFYKIPISMKSWIVVVSAPYTDVTALMQKSMRFYSLLILSIFITTIIASGATIVTYKKRIEAEERTKYLENQRRLEREIEISKDFMENIIENTKTNLMVLDKDLTVKTLNTAQAKTLGRPKQDILGKPFFALFPDTLPPYEGLPLETIFQKTLAGRSFSIIDYKISGLHEQPIYLAMNVSPLLIDGKTPGILITSDNVTMRVQLEEALKHYTEELEVKVDKETATARQLEQQVLHSEKLAALGRVAAGVAHEIGNPLTSISTFAQLLREMANDEFTQSSLDIINNHIQRITEIVRQMSTFARPDSTNIKPAQVNDVVKSSLDLMRLDKRMKSTIQIVQALDPDLPKIMIDEGQMSQVFINIILNALDAMPDGGTLTVATRRGKDEQGHGMILVLFTDTGVGIPKSDLEKIFDPFYTTKEPGKGTGLGLALSYNIVRKFKGDITVESQEGAGSTFTIILPEGTAIHAENEHPRRG
jgi:signal transduction histidine kinase